MGFTGVYAKVLGRGVYINHGSQGWEGPDKVGPKVVSKFLGSSCIVFSIKGECKDGTSNGEPVVKVILVEVV